MIAVGDMIGGSQVSNPLVILGLKVPAMSRNFLAKSKKSG